MTCQHRTRQHRTHQHNLQRSRLQPLQQVSKAAVRLPSPRIQRWPPALSQPEHLPAAKRGLCHVAQNTPALQGPARTIGIRMRGTSFRVRILGQRISVLVWGMWTGPQQRISVLFLVCTASSLHAAACMEGYQCTCMFPRSRLECCRQSQPTRYNQTEGGLQPHIGARFRDIGWYA